ncbi:MAG: hypothetical protein ACRDRR_03215 [Pseudonocardiaceae bacterium]
MLTRLGKIVSQVIDETGLPLPELAGAKRLHDDVLALVDDRVIEIIRSYEAQRS